MEARGEATSLILSFYIDWFSTWRPRLFEPSDVEKPPVIQGKLLIIINPDHSSGIQSDKTMANKLMYSSNDVTQNNQLFVTNLLTMLLFVIYIGATLWVERTRLACDGWSKTWM